MKRPAGERERPGGGPEEPRQAADVAQKSNGVLAAFAPDIRWIESYITEARYLAAVRRRMNPRTDACRPEK